MRDGAQLIVECNLDAEAAAELGESAIAAGAPGDFSDEQMDQLRRSPGPLYILPDANTLGGEAPRQWGRELYPKALLCPAEYGEAFEDLSDVRQARGIAAAREVLEGLKARAVDALELELREAEESPTEGGQSLATYRRTKERILPLVARLEDEGEQDAALHDVAGRLKLSIKPLRKALTVLQAQVDTEAEEEEPGSEDAAPLPGTARYERAMDLLTDHRLLPRAAVDMKKLGHVGEFAAKKLALICGVSARSGNAIQPSTHAQSAAGKNSLWDTALSLFPPEMVVRRSGLSAKALFRTQANLKGAVLYIQEVAGSEDANYTIRVMQSDGRLEYEATEKMPDGGMRNVVYQTEGPTVVVQTTTKHHLHSENETRVFPIYIDESEKQTGRINKQVKREAAGKGIAADERERITETWQDAIRLLEPAEVVIPYAERIEIPNTPLRIRRDARRLIDVVRVIAWLHQRQRKRDAQGRILAEEEDFTEALALVSESLRRAWQTLTPAEEKVLRTIENLPEIQRTRNGFKRRELIVKEVSDRRVKEILKSLADTGYLECDGRQGPQGYTYTLIRNAEEISLGISLRPTPDNPESGSSKPNANGRDAFARYRPVPDAPEQEDGYREAGDTGRSSFRPIDSADLQEKRATGRTGGEERVEKISKDRRLTLEEVEVYKRARASGKSEAEARTIARTGGAL